MTRGKHLMTLARRMGYNAACVSLLGIIIPLHVQGILGALNAEEHTELV
jgi:hypothetical protein